MALLHEQLAPFSKHKGGVGPHARISRCNSVLDRTGKFLIFITGATLKLVANFIQRKATKASEKTRITRKHAVGAH